MTNRLGEKLRAARQKHFVGRETELSQLGAFVNQTGDQLGKQILHILGPGGTGKTSLIRHFLSGKQDEGLTVLSLDARRLDGSRGGFLGLVAEAAGLSAHDDIFAWLDRAGRCLIGVDTFERMASLERWLREDFLPYLGDNVRVITAGRYLRDLHWTTDPGWKAVSDVIQLRHFTPDESRAFAAAQGLSAEMQDWAARCSHGNPLALALLLHTAVADPTHDFSGDMPAEIISPLMKRLLDEPPTPSHRRALALSCLLRITTEELLRDLLDDGNKAAELYEWLEGLSFYESTAAGLWPHDLIRDIVVRDMRIRWPSEHDAMLERARRCYITKVGSSNVARREGLLYDLFFLLRDIPASRMVFGEWGGAEFFLDIATAEEQEEVAGVIGSVEGLVAEEQARFWFTRPETTVYVVRAPSGAWQGFLVNLFFKSNPESVVLEDEVLAAGWRYIKTNGWLQSGETAHFGRWWGLKDGAQEPGPVQTRIFMKLSTMNLSTQGLGFHMSSFRSPEKWLPSTGPFRIKLLAECRHAGQHYGWIGYNWREESISGWLDAITRAVAASPMGTLHEQTIEPLYVLDREEFRFEVKKALKGMRDGDLSKTPLLQSRLVLDRCSPDTPSLKRIHILRQVLVEAIESQAVPQRDNRRYLALRATFLDKPQKQTAAAASIGMAYSTYRYYLAIGLDRVVSDLWALETTSARQEDLCPQPT